MPSDASIFRAASGPMVPLSPSPVKQQSAVATAQAETAKADFERENVRTAAANTAVVQQAYQQSGGDPARAISWLKQNNRGDLAMGLEKSYLDFRKGQAETQLAEDKAHDAQLTQGLRWLQGVTDEASFARVYPMIQQQAPDLAKLMGPTYSKPMIDQLYQRSLEFKDYMDLRYRALNDLREGKQNWLYNALSSAANDEEYQRVLGLARAVGESEDVIASVPPQWSKEAIAHLESRGATPYDRQRLANLRAGAVQDKVESDARVALTNARTNEVNNDISLANKEANTPASAGGGASSVAQRQALQLVASAEAWRASQIQALTKEANQMVWDDDRNEEVPALSQSELAERIEQVEKDYRRRIRVAKMMSPGLDVDAILAEEEDEEEADDADGSGPLDGSFTPDPAASARSFTAVPGGAGGATRGPATGSPAPASGPVGWGRPSAAVPTAAGTSGPVGWGRPAETAAPSSGPAGWGRPPAATAGENSRSSYSLTNPRDAQQIKNIAIKALRDSGHEVNEASIAAFIKNARRMAARGDDLSKYKLTK